MVLDAAPDLHVVAERRSGLQAARELARGGDHQARRGVVQLRADR
jgi:hypothetical protein